MPSSRKAAWSAVNFAGSAPRQRISRESSVMRIVARLFRGGGAHVSQAKTRRPEAGVAPPKVEAQRRNPRHTNMIVPALPRPIFGGVELPAAKSKLRL